MVILSKKKANDLMIINFIVLEALNILTRLMNLAVGWMNPVSLDFPRKISNNNNNNNNTYIALIRMRSKRFTSIVLQYDLEI